MKQIKGKSDSRVTLYPDGKYRWVYEVPMLKNPSILFDVYWVLGISFGLVWLFNVLLIGCEGDLSLESLWDFSSVFLILMLVFAVIGYVAYVIVAWTYGWKYVVLFTLDEKEVVHQQMPRQMKKEGGGTPADAPSDEEGEGAGRIDSPRGCCCRQARSNGIGHPRCLTLDIDLRACKCEKHQGPSPSEPYQGESAAEQEPRLRAR